MLPISIWCPHANRCGGCALIGQPLDEQLSLKRTRVASSIHRFGSLASLRVEPVRPAPTVEGYRLRAKLVVAPGPRLGLYARGTDHEVVDIPDCRVLSPPLAAVATTIRALMGAPPESARPALLPEGTDEGRLRAVDLRQVNVPEQGPRVLVTLVLAETTAGSARRPPSNRAAGAHTRTSEPEAGNVDARHAVAAAAEALCAAAHEVVTVAVSWRRSRSPQLLGSWPEIVRGPEIVPNLLLDAPFEVPTARPSPARPWHPHVYAAPGSFTQVHRSQAAAIYRRAADWLAEAVGTLRDSTIAEMYAGAGGMGMLLAAAGARLTTVESFAPAVAAARRAATELGLDIDARAADVAVELESLHTRGYRPTALVLNPPRSGLPPAVRAACAALRPKAMVYLSCDPGTLARDLADLARLGLAAVALEPFDMIPLTDHVETLALLRPRAPAEVVMVDDSHGLLAVDKPGHEPFAPSRSPRRSLSQRTAEQLCLDELHPVAPLPDGASGLCVLARTKELAAAGRSRLDAAPSPSPCVARYVVLCRGITRTKGRLRGRGAGRGELTYRRLAVVSGHSLLRIDSPSVHAGPVRALLARLGHGVLGDDRYGHGPSNRHASESHGLDRPFLHRLAIRLPAAEGAAAVEWRAPLAADLWLVLQRLDAPASAAWISELQRRE